MLYIYALGCGLACLVLAGISSMETVDVQPARVAAGIVLWPAALAGYAVRRLAARGAHSARRRRSQKSHEKGGEKPFFAAGGCAIMAAKK